jgi:predicted RNase H-like HicB family nuclease
VTSAEANDRARVELALAQLAEVLSDADFRLVVDAAQGVIAAGHTAAELAQDLEEGLALFGEAAVH